MVIIEVPARVYARAVREVDAHHRSAWAVVDVRPGRRWKVHAPPWEDISGIWAAEDILREVRGRLAKAREL